MIPIMTGTEVPKEKMDSAMEDLYTSLQLFEEKFLQGQILHHWRPDLIG